ncbi:MAG: hypothetical protein JSW11_11495 [Candidatus Heimdallarchaeota archaeon]|nr:MAG: hypothetical protein JSW11_11495 [Candidatus Heimdallarchaeota archaeon]
MKAGRIKLTSPEAFMAAFSRYETEKDHDKDKIDHESKKWSQGLLST